MKGALADLKHALRLYRRTPGSSLIAVLVLAVGMAFVGAFLSLYTDLVLKPFPGVERSNELVTIGQVDGTRFTGLPIGLIDRLNSEMSSLDTVVGFITTSIEIADDSERVRFEGVTRGFFDGIRPNLATGRGFDDADYEPDSEPVLVISDRFWRNRLEAAPDVLGTTIELDQQFETGEETGESGDTSVEFRIVGIMAPDVPGFFAPEVDVWSPFDRLLPLLLPAEMADQIRVSLTMQTLARLRAGATPVGVVSELESRYPESTEEYRLQTGFRFDAIRGVVRNLNVHRDAQRQLTLFLAGSVLLALVAAANVSLFLLARAPGRRRELAIRMSVGAPVRRLARQLASEAGVLVVVAAALGLLISVWLVSFLRSLAFLRQAEWRDVTLLDWRVLTLVGVFLLVLTTLVSLAPILGLKRIGIAHSSRQVAARASVAQRVAGTVQIAIAGTIGGAAIGFAWFLASMTLGYPGYEFENRHAVRFNPVFDSDGRISFFMTSAVDAARNRETIESLPGVSAVTFSSLAPATSPTIGTQDVTDPSDPSQQIRIGAGTIDDRFVDVLGLRLLHGRTPEPDEEGVALVNQAMAQLYFGRDDVVGESLDIRNQAGPTTRIVGVLEDLSFVHPAADVGPILFTKLPPTPFGMRAIIESPLPAAELQQQLQGLIDSGELELGEPFVNPLADSRANLLAPDTARSWLTIGTAALVVVLAAFGFYGTQRYLVSAGRREYAIRASLGAGPKALGRLVFGRGLLLSLPGLVIGAFLSFILVAWLRDDFLSREISPGLVTAIVIAGLTLLLLAASLGPAHQARRTQPAPLLKED